MLARAKQAWTWAASNPNVKFYNSGIVGAGEQETDAKGRALKKLQAAAFLFEPTGDATYKTFFDANYGSTQLIGSSYLDMFDLEPVDTLLEYTKATGATASVVSDIHAKFAGGFGSANNLGATLNNSDPYLGFIYLYVWGSNQNKSDQGNLLMANVAFAVDASKNADATRGAERYVHWMLGTNPLSLVYLTSMPGAYGLGHATTRIYHTWFANGSIYPPPPGYLPGGTQPIVQLGRLLPRWVQRQVVRDASVASREPAAAKVLRRLQRRLAHRLVASDGARPLVSGTVPPPPVEVRSLARLDLSDDERRLLDEEHAPRIESEGVGLRTGREQRRGSVVARRVDLRDGAAR